MLGRVPHDSLIVTDALPNVGGRSHAPRDWANFVNRQLCRLQIKLQGERGFQVGASVHQAGSFKLARITTFAGQAQLERRRTEIRMDSEVRYAAYVPLNGEHDLAQSHRETRCTSRGMALINSAEAFLQAKLGDNDTLYFCMPAQFVDERLADASDICARTISVESGIGRLARDTLAALQREAFAIGEMQFVAAARSAGELLLLALGGAADVTSNMSSIRAGNLARAKRIIRLRLTDPELSLEGVAQECGISLRYLHDLFRDDGQTAAGYLRRSRLQLAHRMLESGIGGMRGVTEVSMACGFSSPSQFATAFKRMFGKSPRDVARFN